MGGFIPGEPGMGLKSHVTIGTLQREEVQGRIEKKSLKPVCGLGLFL